MTMTSRINVRGFRYLALAFAMIAFFLPFPFYSSAYIWVFDGISFLASALWVVVVVLLLKRVGRHELWSLLELPLVLIRPLGLGWLYYVCVTTRDCL